MRQYAFEHGQVYRLYDTIKITSYKDVDSLRVLPFEEQERIRQDSYSRKIDQMQPGEIGVMPDLEYLSQLDIHAARPVLRSIARASGLSNAKSSKQKFFSNRKAA